MNALKEAITIGRKDLAAHSGIQPWSKGALFPGVIKRVETYLQPGDIFICESATDTRVAMQVTPLEHRLVKTQWAAIYGADERLCDTYEEAEQFILTRKELDEEEKPYGRLADGIYQGELQNLERAVPASIAKRAESYVKVREYGTDQAVGTIEDAVGLAHARIGKAIAVTFEHGNGNNTIHISHGEALQLANQLNALRAGVRS